LNFRAPWGRDSCSSRSVAQLLRRGADPLVSEIGPIFFLALLVPLPYRFPPRSGLRICA
jgi:hypothetical protein